MAAPPRSQIEAGKQFQFQGPRSLICFQWDGGTMAPAYWDDLGICGIGWRLLMLVVYVPKASAVDRAEAL